MGISNPPLTEDIRRNHKIAQLVKKPRKAFTCRDCSLPTEAGEPHYTVTWGGAGLGSIKFPSRICVGCIPAHMGLNPTWEEREEDWGRLSRWCRLNYAELEAKGRMRGWGICLQKIWQDFNRRRANAVRG